MHSIVRSTLTPTFDAHTLLSDLNDPQIELHLLRGCLNTCKVNHLLRTVPFEDTCDPIYQFDLSLRLTLGQILHCTLTDPAWPSCPYIRGAWAEGSLTFGCPAWLLLAVALYPTPSLAAPLWALTFSSSI